MADDFLHFFGLILKNSTKISSAPATSFSVVLISSVCISFLSVSLALEDVIEGCHRDTGDVFLYSVNADGSNSGSSPCSSSWSPSSTCSISYYDETLFSRANCFLGCFRRFSFLFSYIVWSTYLFHSTFSILFLFPPCFAYFLSSLHLYLTILSNVPFNTVWTVLIISSACLPRARAMCSSAFPMHTPALL